MEKIPAPETLRITRHVLARLDERRITRQHLFDALRDPEVTYPNPGHPNQVRVVKGHLIVVVDLVRKSIPTVLYNKANDGWKGKADLRFA